MPIQNTSILSDKKSKTLTQVIQIAEALQSVLPEGEEASLDTVENALTPILNDIRKHATERYFDKRDSDKHYCPACGRKTYLKQKRVRKITGLAKYEINRRAFYCKSCKVYCYPLDQKLGLSGRFSFEVRKAALLLGQRIPFQEASDYLHRLLGVDMSDQTILTLVESVGQKVHVEDLHSIRKTLNEEGVVKVDVGEA